VNVKYLCYFCHLFTTAAHLCNKAAMSEWTLLNSSSVMRLLMLILGVEIIEGKLVFVKRKSDCHVRDVISFLPLFCQQQAVVDATKKLKFKNFERNN